MYTDDDAHAFATWLETQPCWWCGELGMDKASAWPVYHYIFFVAPQKVGRIHAACLKQMVEPYDKSGRRLTLVDDLVGS